LDFSTVAEGWHVRRFGDGVDDLEILIAEI